MSIDPEKLLELARRRHHDGGVTLAWPAVLNIIEELRQLQREVGYLRNIERHVAACRFHDRDFEACMQYSGTVPCESDASLAPAKEEAPRFVYCPTCWPGDIGDHGDSHCLFCGTTLASASTEQQVDLLTQQVEALTDCLSEAMQWLGDAGVPSVPRRPVLRLVHSASKKNDKEPSS